MTPITELPAEAFMRRIAAGIEDARASGASDAGGIAAALNARGLTSCKGRPWTAEAVAKFLDSPGARRLGLSA